MHASVALCIWPTGLLCTQTLMTWGLEGGAMPGQSSGTVPHTQLDGTDREWPRMQSALPHVALADIFRYHNAFMSCLRDSPPGTVFKVSTPPRPHSSLSRASHC